MKKLNTKEICTCTIDTKCSENIIQSLNYSVGQTHENIKELFGLQSVYTAQHSSG